MRFCIIVSLLFSIAPIMAEQSLEVDTSVVSSESGADNTATSSKSSSSSVSYISGTISYAINTNTLVISYSTNSDSEIIAVSGTTVGSKNDAGNLIMKNKNEIFGLLAGILLL